MKLNNNKKIILKYLRCDARKNFSSISREANIPVTTVFDNYQKLRDSHVITKHSSLLDFRKLGFYNRNFIFIKAKDKEALLAFLSNNPSVNSIFKISNYDFMAEVICPTIKEFYAFLDELKDFNIQKLETHDVIEHIKQEEFFTN